MFGPGGHFWKGHFWKQLFPKRLHYYDRRMVIYPHLGLRYQLCSSAPQRVRSKSSANLPNHLSTPWISHEKPSCDKIPNSLIHQSNINRPQYHAPFLLMQHQSNSTTGSRLPFRSCEQSYQQLEDVPPSATVRRTRWKRGRRIWTKPNYLL